MFIQHNLLAENANRQLNVSSKRNAKTTEKLSSGYRINRAADDAAGLSISEKMRRQIRGLHQTVDNISEGVGYVQTAEGALNEVHDMLQRMNELAVKAANGTNTEEDRAYIDSEVQALKDEMDRIFRTTTFNERKIWEPGDRKLLGYETVRAVSQQNIPQTIDITNENYGVLPGEACMREVYLANFMMILVFIKDIFMCMQMKRMVFKLHGKDIIMMGQKKKNMKLM